MRGVLSSIRRDGSRLVEKARAVPSMTGLDLASAFRQPKRYKWDEGVEPCRLGAARRPPASPTITSSPTISASSATSCGAWSSRAARVTVVPALTPAEDVLALKPDGIFLSNGPGDPEPLESQAGAGSQADRQEADLRHLPRPSDPRPGARRQDVQAEVRASRRESSGAEQSHEQGRDHVAQSRLRGGSGLAATTTRSKSRTST